MDDGTSTTSTRDDLESPSPSPSPAAPAPAISAQPDRARRPQTLAIVVTVLALVVTTAVLVLFFLARESRETALRDRDRARAELDEVQSRLDAETQRLSAAEETAEAQASVLRASEANADRLAEELAGRQESLDTYRDATLELLTIAFSEGSGVEPAGAECIAIAFIDEQEGVALQGIVDAANGGSSLGPLGRDLDRYESECGVDLEEAVAGATAGQAYGDDPVVDGVWDACASGNGQACDDLYLDSATGSEYERFGLACGDRFIAAEAPDLCADAI